MVSTSASGAQRTAPGSRGRGPTPTLPPSADRSTRARRPHRDDAPVQRITTAPVGQRQHQQQQIGRYLWSMGIRTACFVVAIVLAQAGYMALMWVFVTLAVVLPYIAVLVANAGRETVGPTTTQVTPPARPSITAAPPRPAAEPPLVGEVFQGRVFDADEPTDAGRPGAEGTDPGSTGAGPRTWEAERLRPPADGGDRRSAA
ncbi:DUF3099 domain-containing protein [uncultured Pseudokineococcus sp.]|uniref:DUF3099 domain-containing protein n=1 Tax=uncultured Pseudokineococcus sp. TaxID=1642928 RepID=UPI0026356A00|nr:DUF3099 domain-containing protein [uncultured Pseudokineococcus sp.]